MVRKEWTELVLTRGLDEKKYSSVRTQRMWEGWRIAWHAKDETERELRSVLGEMVAAFYRSCLKVPDSPAKRDILLEFVDAPALANAMLVRLKSKK